MAALQIVVIASANTVSSKFHNCHEIVLHFYGSGPPPCITWSTPNFSYRASFSLSVSSYSTSGLLTSSLRWLRTLSRLSALRPRKVLLEPFRPLFVLSLRLELIHFFIRGNKTIEDERDGWAVVEIDHTNKMNWLRDAYQITRLLWPCLAVVSLGLAASKSADAGPDFLRLLGQFP